MTKKQTKIRNSRRYKIFLEKSIAIYGYTLKDTYKEIASKTGGISYSTVRLYLLALERLKMLKIKNKGKNCQTYFLNKDKVDKFLNN
jgi:DNA-binding transcriptional ArsR family regulator